MSCCWRLQPLLVTFLVAALIDSCASMLTYRRAMLSRMNAMMFRQRELSSGKQTDYDLDTTLHEVNAAVQIHSERIIMGLKTDGWSMIDGFLQSGLCGVMRDEAVFLYENNYFDKSQSTRWDWATQSVVAYDKHNVFSTQLNGGEAYFQAPRLHEYLVGMTRAVVPILSSAFPEAQLSPSMMSNKLAVCTGNGSAYDKHYDNSGLSDTRKVTVLYYMNQWRPECGGCFRIYSSNDTVIDIEPVADRLLVFWSDRLVHSVQPSEAPRGAADHRYALTLWLTSVTADAIVRDDAEVKRHFGGPS